MGERFEREFRDRKYSRTSVIITSSSICSFVCAYFIRALSWAVLFFPAVLCHRGLEAMFVAMWASKIVLMGTNLAGLNPDPSSLSSRNRRPSAAIDGLQNVYLA